jgi:hypothetical protein
MGDAVGKWVWLIVVALLALLVAAVVFSPAIFEAFARLSGGRP